MLLLMALFGVGVAVEISWPILALLAVLMAVPMGLLFGLQSKHWKRLDSLSQQIYKSDLASLAYRGGNSAADRTEVAINSLTSQQTTLVELLKYSSDHLNSAVSKTTEVVSACNHGVNEQRNDISQLATAVNELSSTIQEVARHAQETATTAQEAVEEVENGNQVVDNAVGAIQVLAEDVGKAGDLILTLRDEAQSISNIVSVINGVAEQTNLLALNAAIEAARAGEQGRGFAVVADEVRSLATRTQESTSEIEAMINNLRTHVDGIVEVTEVTQSHASDTVSETQQIKSLLQSVTDRVQSASDMNIQIATATEEQSAVTEEINRNVTNIHDSVQEISEASEMSAVAGQELESVASSLNSMLTHFRKS
ncbi:MAG: methyl-accepting chemotaxis protein [Motiliproteus sp.]|nr:methyl-accepting chemotaxis protein [Motiliproteus sp.]